MAVPSIEVEAALERAEVAERLGRLGEARRILGEQLLAAPEDARLLERIGDIALQLEDLDEAMRFAGAAIAASPDRADAHLTVALVYDARGQYEDAIRHARLAVSLEPSGVREPLILARIIAESPKTDARPEARAALERAATLAPESAGMHAHAAETYWRMHDREGAERHVAAGLAVDPAHEDLLQTRARLDFELASADSRIRAVDTLRGLLSARPGHRKARRLLAEIMWRALLRLAAWVWFFAATVAVVSMWLGPGVLRVVTPVLFWIIPVAWFRVFRRLRPQLPPGYLRARVLRRPAALLGMIVLVLASVLVDLGAVTLRSELASLVRGGYLLLFVAAIGAGLAHLLLLLAWVRRGDEEVDRSAAEDFALLSAVLIVIGGLILAGILAALRHWARQPIGFAAFVAIVGVVVVTLALEVMIIGVLKRDLMWTVFLLPVVALVSVAIWWGAEHLVTDQVRGTTLTVPAPPTFRPLPTAPSLHLPPPALHPPAPPSATPVSPGR
ncbi:tetratricopeptide repeat protein [Nocardia sp. NPDC052566]|uniref:tetratricopeptide repeat protein n=1 Tax=Nocardia sp. NPDC052566 TaxID=3364330 RepID=UPI0037C8D756